LAACILPVLGSRDRPSAHVDSTDTTNNALLGPVLGAFSQLAVVSIVGLTVTGAYQAVVHVGSLDAALSSDYGKAVLVKTLLFGSALLLGGFHHWWLLPALADPRKRSATRSRRFLSRTLPIEALLGVAILAATGLLTSL